MENLTIKWVPAADAAYLALTEIPAGASVGNIQMVDRAGSLVGVLDLDARGRVLGIEFLNATERLPHPPAESAAEPGWRREGDLRPVGGSQVPDPSIVAAQPPGVPAGAGAAAPVTCW